MSQPKVKLSIECECCPDNEVVECDRVLILAQRDGQDLERLGHNVSDSDIFEWMQMAIRGLFDEYAQDEPEPE